MTFDGGRCLKRAVYLIVSKATETVVDLSYSRMGFRSPIHHSFNQLWLIEQVPNQVYYTVRNVRSDTYMDLRGGLAVNGTDVRGWEGNDSAAQHWYIDGDDQGGHTIKNRASGMVLDLRGGQPANGTAIKCHSHHGRNNQIWYLRCHSRAPGEVDSLLRASQHIGMNFNRYVGDTLYVTLPIGVVNLIWAKKGIVSRRRRSESYDYNDFAFAMKTAVGDWVHDNVRAPVAVVFGVMYCTFGTGQGGHAYNWYPTPDFSSIQIFDPQNGETLSSSRYNAYFGIY
ncbi:hypothetical protein BC826DRAFT_1014885 [Russula brevipes]|nr:hypothetical protein BC826DRAFT_1014885 [Russula brevipes]